MLEAPPAPSGAPWRAPPDAEAVDALPYIDGDYGDPAVKREVDRMVEEEMRRGSRKPADFLRDLPPVPAIGFEVDSRSLISSPLLVGSWSSSSSASGSLRSTIFSGEKKNRTVSFLSNVIRVRVLATCKNETG